MGAGNCEFVTGEMKRGENCNLVAIKSIFGWVNSRPTKHVDHGDHYKTGCISMVHVFSN